MNFKDPYVALLSKVLLSALFVVFLYASVVSLGVVIDWFSTEGSGPGDERLADLARLLPTLSGRQADELLNTIGVFMTALPLAVTPICFTHFNGGRTLNGFGKVFATGLLVVCLISVAAYAFLDPAQWGDGHVLSEGGLDNVREWAKTALRGAVFYLATLLGMKGAE